MDLPHPFGGRATIELAVVLALVGLLAPSAARAPAAAPVPRRAAPVVLFLGDSNVAIAGRTIRAALQATDAYRPLVVAKVGAPILDEDLIASLSTAHVDAVVTDLGANNTATVQRDYRSQMARFLSAVPPGTVLFWTNLPCEVEPASRSTACALVNDALTHATAARPGVVLVDWAAAAANHPEYMVDPATNVHLSAAGRAAWVDVVVDALDSHFASR